MQPSRQDERKWQESILPPIQVFVKFYDAEIVDIQASNQQGRRVMKNATLIEKKVKGDRFSLINSEATAKDFRQHPKEYNQYLELKNDNQESNGYQADNQESNGYRGGRSQAAIASGRANESERSFEAIAQRTKAKRTFGDKGIRTGRGQVRISTDRQTHTSEQTCGGSFRINFGTFSVC